MAASAQAQPNEKAQKVFDFWTPERISQAEPRDLYLDHRGLPYTKNKKGDFVPYGKNKEKYQPMRPGNGNGGGGGGGGGGKPSSGPDVGNAAWSFGGAVQTAAGRLLYQMPNNGGWSSYVCSGTVVTDGTTGRSIIITAAHCVYDDADNAFARNVLFIPNQNDTTGSATDSNCSNDPMGCWTTSFGVVEQNWTNKTFPNNIPWDYAYYVVNDSGSHSGNGSGGAMDMVTGHLQIDFTVQNHDLANDDASAADFTHGLGYSYSDDPNFMYCADNLTEKADYTLPGSNVAANWWIPVCDLSGGSSGGPWAQPMDEASGTGFIMSVNSWGYTRKNRKGMAGPKLAGTTAECLFEAAKTGDLSIANNADGDQGIIVTPGSCN